MLNGNLQGWFHVYRGLNNNNNNRIYYRGSLISAQAHCSPQGSSLVRREFTLIRGWLLKQGSTLSAMLFNLYVNDLAHELQPLLNIDDDNISVLLHVHVAADDQVILAESPEDLHCQLNTLTVVQTIGN